MSMQRVVWTEKIVEGGKSLDLTLEPADSQRLANLCGQLDEHLRQLERRLGWAERMSRRLVAGAGEPGLALELYREAGERLQKLLESAGD